MQDFGGFLSDDSIDNLFIYLWMTQWKVQDFFTYIPENQLSFQDSEEEDLIGTKSLSNGSTVAVHEVETHERCVLLDSKL